MSHQHLREKKILLERQLKDILKNEDTILYSFNSKEKSLANEERLANEKTQTKLHHVKVYLSLILIILLTIKLTIKWGQFEESIDAIHSSDSFIGILFFLFNIAVWLILAFLVSSFIVYPILLVLYKILFKSFLFNPIKNHFDSKERKKYVSKYNNELNKRNVSLKSLINKKKQLIVEIDSIDNIIMEDMIKEKERERLISKQIEVENKRIQNSIKKNYKEGLSNFEHKKFRNAILNLNIAISLESDNNQFYYLRGLSKLKMNDYAGAIDDLTVSINLSNSMAEVFYYRGKTFRITEEYKDAIADFNEAIAIKQEYSKAFYERGLVKSILGDKRGALNDYNRSIDINPKNKKAFYQRGNIYKELNKLDEACEDWSRAGELGYFEAYEQIQNHCN